jgi:hypothetical protein
MHISSGDRLFRMTTEDLRQRLAYFEGKLSEALPN